MKTWMMYAGVGLLVTLLLAVAAMLAVGSQSAAAVWFGAAVAYVLQVVSFAVLVAVRGRSELFLLGWGAGLVARFGAIGVVAYWLGRSGALPRAPALLSLVGFLFVLLLMEPLFLRRGLQTQ